MSIWTLFFNREVTHEAFQPNHEERECCPSASFDARLEAIRNADAILDEALDQLAAHEAKARPTARVFLIRSPRVQLYPLALFFKSRGYRLKQDGRGFVEVVR